MTLSNIAMIVFFTCFAIIQFVGSWPIVVLVQGIAAIVAAVALLARK